MTLRIENAYPLGEFESRFCSRCNARCCRNGVWIPLLPREFLKVNELARNLNVDVKLSLQRIDDRDQVWVMSHGVICGFLDQKTNRCLIYKDRPEHCRQFYCEMGFASANPNYNQTRKPPIFF